MYKTIEGNFCAEGRRFCLVVSRFNHFITDRLLEGAIDTLVRHGAREESLEVVRVPGCFEIPLAANKLARSERYDAVICIGALIRGSTPHFDYIAAESIKGIAHSALETGVVLTYGVLTVDNLEQAIERAGTKAGNKGSEAALAAIEMVNLLHQI